MMELVEVDSIEEDEERRSEPWRDVGVVGLLGVLEAVE